MTLMFKLVATICNYNEKAEKFRENASILMEPVTYLQISCLMRQRKGGKKVKMERRTKERKKIIEEIGRIILAICN